MTATLEKAAPTKETAPAVRREPLDLFGKMEEEFARLWNQVPFGFFGRRTGDFPRPWLPQTDVFEKENQLTIKLELPGIAKEDVRIELDGTDLIITGERKAEHEVKEEHYYRMERQYGTFYRLVPLQFAPPVDQVSAIFADGVLTISMPKPSAIPAATQTIPVK